MHDFLTGLRAAGRGFLAAVRQERHMRLHLLAALVVGLAGLRLHLSPWEWAAVILTSALVVAAELFNTAVEALVDLLHPRWHPRAGLVKDTAAAAVLVAAVAAVLVGILVFGPRIALW